MTAERFPLHWPQGQPRTPSYRRREAKFQTEFLRARDDTLKAIKLLGGLNVILSTNIALRLDGLPLANQREPEDPGVALYFDRTINGQRRAFVIACDSYSKVKWNLRAVGATVDALRAIQRHGASSMLEQAFTGFAALPPMGATKPWWEVLGVSEYATAEQARAAHRQLAMLHHPDRGGDAQRMAEINRALEQAMQGAR
ncbi:MAG TPA: J domain-containing protein [Xanthobacteraceae bacterium]|nr:J domain-containing protein [Xanthobacteraceae bacterium]